MVRISRFSRAASSFLSYQKLAFEVRLRKSVVEEPSPAQPGFADHAIQRIRIEGTGVCRQTQKLT